MRTLLSFFVNLFVIITFVTLIIYIFPVENISSYCSPGFIQFYESLFGNLHSVETLCLIFPDPIMLIILATIAILTIYIVKVFIRSSYHFNSKF